MKQVDHFGAAAARKKRRRMKTPVRPPPPSERLMTWQKEEREEEEEKPNYLVCQMTTTQTQLTRPTCSSSSLRKRDHHFIIGEGEKEEEEKEERRKGPNCRGRKWAFSLLTKKIVFLSENSACGIIVFVIIAWMAKSPLEGKHSITGRGKKRRKCPFAYLLLGGIFERTSHDQRKRKNKATE